MSYTETVDSKAARLVRDGKVTRAQSAALVAGDHDTHMVRRTETGWTCTCPWGVNRPDAKACSHVLAAALSAPAAPPSPPAASAVFRPLPPGVPPMEIPRRGSTSERAQALLDSAKFVRSGNRVGVQQSGRQTATVEMPANGHGWSCSYHWSARDCQHVRAAQAWLRGQEVVR